MALEKYTKYIDENGVCIIPDGVTEIEEMAFLNCKSLKRIFIPNSVTSIKGGYSKEHRNPCGAFAGCSSLTEISIPNSVTEIGKGAFDGCSSLTDISIPNSVAEISAGTFHNCEKLNNVTIPDSVRYIRGNAGVQYNLGLSAPFNASDTASAAVIGDFGAFENCTSLTSITIPSSVEAIEKNAFSGCINLRSFYCSNRLIRNAKITGLPKNAVIEAVCDDNSGNESIKDEINIMDDMIKIGDSLILSSVIVPSENKIHSETVHVLPIDGHMSYSELNSEFAPMPASNNNPNFQIPTTPAINDTADEKAAEMN